MDGESSARHDPALQRRDVRMSDADRERVVAWLHSAVSEGRLTLDEFSERVNGVLHSRTFGEADRYVADLPAVYADGSVTPSEALELRAALGPLRRRGRWTVPRRLVVRDMLGHVKLDFTEAVIERPVIEIDLDVSLGTTVLVLPAGASANVDGVELAAGSIRMHGVEPLPRAGTGPHLVVTGTQRFGNLVVRRQHRFWRWRW